MITARTRRVSIDAALTMAYAHSRVMNPSVGERTDMGTNDERMMANVKKIEAIMKRLSYEERQQIIEIKNGIKAITDQRGMLGVLAILICSSDNVTSGELK